MYLIKNCPDFPFMASLYYDKVFREYGEFDRSKDWTKQNWKCPAFWKDNGFIVYQIEKCSEEDAEYTVYGNDVEKIKLGCIDAYREAISCSIAAGKQAGFYKIAKEI